MIDYLLYLIYKIFKYITLLLPKFLVKFFLDFMYHLIYFIDTKHKKYAKANLDFVYQDKISQERKYQIIKNSYKNLVYNLYEFVQNQTLTLEQFEQKLNVINEHYLTDAIKNKKKIILITAHYGNWEYGFTFIPLKYAPTTMVGRPMNNKYFNDELNKTRIRNNNEMLPKKDASRGLIKALKQNRILGLAIDQHNKYGIDVEFLGHKVIQADSSSRLAIKFDALIIPVFFPMVSFGKYNVEFLKPIDHNQIQAQNDKQKIQILTQLQANIMSDYILKYPDQWFWQHKRFKKYNGEIYE